MSDQPRADDSQDIDEEIKQAMNDAEAAVDAVRDGDGPPGGDTPSGDAPAASNVELTELRERLETVQSEAAGLRDKWLRAVADYENFKKRVRRETDEAVTRGVQSLLGDFLPVADNLARALQAASDEEDQVAQGVRMVAKEFENALAKHGIKPIITEGETFDPALHDALQQVDSPDHAPGEIIQEFERGYLREGRLLRPARVVVAGMGSTGGNADAESDADGGATPDDAGDAKE